MLGAKTVDSLGAIGVRLYTIGFTQKTAERFFGLLGEHGVGRVIDIRLRPDGQLAGFAKRADLPFFLDRLAGCDYRHLPLLAPSDDLLSSYRKSLAWERYEPWFEALMDERDVPRSLDRALFEERACCLLCGEPTPERCHRRLVAERLAAAWPGTQIVHLL